jgi:alkaline phosphatase
MSVGGVIQPQVAALQVDYLLGLFSPGHMPYALERDHGPNGSPSLQNMTSQAMNMLSKNPSGYLLLVEGGRIDHGHHANYALLALHEAAELDDAVAYAAAITDPADTLIIVTADHSHSFTINGYPNRGNDILGTVLNVIKEVLEITNTFLYIIQQELK